MDAYWRTNLTLRQIAPLFSISKSTADRIIDHLGPKLALEPRQRFRDSGRTDTEIIYGTSLRLFLRVRGRSAQYAAVVPQLDTQALNAQAPAASSGRPVGVSAEGALVTAPSMIGAYE